MLKFLSSLKLAVIIIAAIAVMAVLATIYPEADAFNSWSFRILVIAFFLNLGLCTVQLLPGLWKKLHRTAQNVTDAESYKTYDADEKGLTTWLQENHYKIDRVEENGLIKILAWKGRAGLCAAHVLHVSLLVILVGALFSTFNADGFVMGQVGQTRPFPEGLESTYGEDCTVKIRDFKTVYDDQNAVDNWVTHFDLYIDGKLEVENAETRVNSPYRYKNMLIYQNSYDYRNLFEVKGSPNPDENTTYGLPDNKPGNMAGMTVVASDIGGKVYLQIGDHKNPPRGQYVKPGDVVDLDQKGATITYLDTAQYTILEMKERKGTNIVFAGFILAVLASFLFLFGRYRELQIVFPEGNKNCRIGCFCKSNVIVEEIEEELTEKWGDKAKL